MGQALPVQPGQFRQERAELLPLHHHHGPAGEGVLEGVARVPKGQQLHRAPLTGEGEFLELPPCPGVGELPPQHQGEDPVAQRRRNEDAPHPQRGPQQAPGHHRGLPGQGDQQQQPPKGAGEDQKQPPCPQQLLGPAIGHQEHGHRRPGLAGRVLQKGPARQQGQGGIPCPQPGGQGHPPPAPGLPVQPASAGQQQIVHPEVQGQEGVQIDHRHSIPPSSPLGLAPIIAPPPTQKKSQQGAPAQQKSKTFRIERSC